MGTFSNTFSNTFGVQLGVLLSLKPPTAFTSSFVVDTILGQLNWTNNAGATAQYEVYSSTNGGADVLLATTAAGATSYQDTTCKQNASVVYKIRVKKGTKFGDLVSASALATPLCWKTNQSTLGTVTIDILNVAAGKTVTFNWGDGTSQAYTGNNTNITKNYAATGQYNIWLTGDVNDITSIAHTGQLKSSGNLTNWIIPTSLNDRFMIYSCSFTGDISNWIIPTNCYYFYVYNNNFTGKLPKLTSGSGANYQARLNNLSGSDMTIFRSALSQMLIHDQKVVFPTSEIDKLLKVLADWYQVNAPTANCTINMSGANMGIPTGGASNADLTRLVGYYTAAGRTATVIVRTS